MPPSLWIIPSPSAIASVPIEEPPSIKFNSVVVAVTPSNKFTSVAVAVIATSSFSFGDVNVLFVNVAVEAVETKSTSPPVLGSVKVFEAPSECGAAWSACAWAFEDSQ